MKKAISFILALLMIFGTAVSTFAAVVKPVADATAVKAGENISVKIELDQKIENILQFEYSLYFDSNVFDLESSAVGAACPAAQISKVKNDKKGSYYSISFLDAASEGQTINAGTIFTLNFKAKEDISEQKMPSFKLEKVYLTNGDFEQVDDGNVEGGEFTVTVTPVACEHTETETAYTSKGNGKHTVTVTCKKCGEVISTADEACTKGENGKCVHCGYVFPVSGDEYTVTVKVVPNTVDVTFYSGENAETELPKNKVEHVGIDGNYNVYKLTVPKGTYSYRATDSEDDVYLGGMSFAVPVSTEVDSEGNTMITDQSITLVRNNFYTTNNKVSAIGDYSIDIYPAGRATVVNGNQYIKDNGYVVTPAMLQAHGNALLYNYRITLNGELGNNYGVPFVSNYTITSTVSATQNRTFFLNELTAYSITAPTGATVKYFRQINNFNVEEIPVSETVTNDDGTVTYKVKVTGPNYTYRVSMEGKLTKAGYLNAKQKEFVITFGENEYGFTTQTKVVENAALGHD